MPKFGRCSICTDGFGIHNVTVLKGCGHTFHHKCITLWLNTKKTCPNCRKKALERDVAKLFIDEAERASTSSSFLAAEEGPAVEALRDEIEREKEAKQKLLETMGEMQEQRESLLADLAKERTQTQLMRQKEEHIRSLEAMLSDQSALQRELEEYRRRLRASELWSVLCRNNDDGRAGEREIDRLLGREGDPDSAKFLGMLKSQLSNLREQYKKLDGEHAEARVKLEKYKRLTHNLEQSEKSQKEEVMELRKKCVNLRKQLISVSSTLVERADNRQVDLSTTFTTTMGSPLGGALPREERSFGFSFNYERDANFGLDKTSLLLSAGKDARRDSGLDCAGGWDLHDETESHPKETAVRTETWEGEDIEIPASVLRRTQQQQQKLKRPGALPSSPVASQPKKTPATSQSGCTTSMHQPQFDHAIGSSSSGSSEVHEASFNFSIEQLSPSAGSSSFRVTLVENEAATKKGCQPHKLKPVVERRVDNVTRVGDVKREVEIIDLC